MTAESERCSFGIFNHHFHQPKFWHWKFTWSFWINSRFCLWKFQSLFVSTSFDAGNFCRILYQAVLMLEISVVIFDWLHWNVDLRNFHGCLICITSRKFWRWEFQSPICIALEYDIQQIVAYLFLLNKKSIFFNLKIFSMFLLMNFFPYN